jgi:hypothetical protein
VFESGYDELAQGTCQLETFALIGQEWVIGRLILYIMLLI